MIISFGDKRTESIFHGVKTKDTRKIDSILLTKVERKLDLINAASVLDDLKIPPGNKLEPLLGNLKGFHSIRVDGQWRIIFKWENNSPTEVEFIDYH
jgi:proteic killer suppression protein